MSSNSSKREERNEQKEETNNSKTINRKRKCIEQLADSSSKLEELSRNDLSKGQGQELNLLCFATLP